MAWSRNFVVQERVLEFYAIHLAKITLDLGYTLMMVETRDFHFRWIFDFHKIIGTSLFFLTKLSSSILPKNHPLLLYHFFGWKFFKSFGFVLMKVQCFFYKFIISGLKEDFRESFALREISGGPQSSLNNLDPFWEGSSAWLKFMRSGGKVAARSNHELFTRA